MNKNVGYHAGDLGKSEYYYQQSGGRGTGHFGTGTYFVGDPKEIENYNTRDGKPAPKHIVDFTPYKLYKPNNENTASDLHSALKLLNDYKSYMETDEVFDKIIDEYKYLKKYFDIDYNRYSPRWTRVDILRGWENNKYTIIDYINDLIDYYNATQDVKYLNPEHMGNISYDPDDDYFMEVLEGAIKTLVNELSLEDKIETKEMMSDENLIRKFYMFPKDDVIYALEKVVEAQNFAKSQGGWYGSFGQKWDSLSTVFMKALGYEGVDVRHLPRFDNTTYGSVIYDLKPETIVESFNITEKIVKVGSKWQVQSEKGRNMGTYDNKEDAEKRLQQVHYFKHKNEMLYESKQDRINFENIVGKELSDRFFELKHRLNPPQNDLYYWVDKDISELENVLNSIEKSRKEKEDEAREGTDLVYEDDTWLVLKINTHEASKKYGKGTKWCISGEGDWKSRTTKYHNSKEVWDDYVNNHHAQIWFFINKKDNHKYCVVRCSVTLDGRTATGLEIYDDTNRMIVEIPNAPRTSVPSYSGTTEQLFSMLDNFVDTENIVNLISYDPDEAMTHQDIRVDLDDGTIKYFRFDRYGRIQEIQEKDLDTNLKESFESNDFKLGYAGFIKDDGTLIYADILDDYMHGGVSMDILNQEYPEFSNTHPEEDTCIRLYKEPNSIQYKRLEEILDKYLDIEGYCKVELWDNGEAYFYQVYSLYDGACDEYYNDIENVGNWTGYKLVQLIKAKFNKTMNESLLLEKTRSELIAKSKKSDKYKSKDREGENRWTRRTKSRIATKVADYNKIDMDAFFRGDILDFIVAVQGETNNYEVLVTFEDILHELQNQIKANKNKLEFKCVLRALINQFNRGSVYVSCSCPDWTYRQAYWSTKGQYNSGQPQPSNGKMIANPGDTKGAGCKHVNLVLANLDWIMKIASVINNYIYWARDNMEYQYGKLIFPKLFGMPYDKAIQLTLDMYDENGNLKPEYTEDRLRSDLDTINMSNMIGSKRTQYKKKPEVSVNPRYEPPKKEEPVSNDLELEFGEDKELVTDEEEE